MNILENPELRRLAWLDLTPARLIAMPLVLGLLLLLALLTEAQPAAIGGVALTIHLLLTHFIGLRQAAESVAEEFRTRTWDAQRMSVLSPRELALGKLLGANLLSWYGGVLCLAAFVFFMRQQLPAVQITWVVVFVLGSALLLQSLGMFLALLSPGARSLRLPYLLLLAFVALPVIGGLYPLFIGERASWITWYGLTQAKLPFAALSVWSFALWAVLGVVRLMASELQVRTTPAVWCGFLLFVTAYLGGFVIDRDTPLLSALVFLMLTGCAACAGGSYLAAWFESRDIRRYKRLGLAWAAGRGQRALEELPAWAAALMIATALALLLVPGLAVVSAQPFGAMFTWLDETSRFGPFSPIAVVLLAMRDIACLQGMAFTRGTKRSDLAIMVYLLLAYLILPSLFSVFGARAVVLPNPFTQPVAAAVVFGIHLALVLVWVRRRWLAVNAT